MHQTKGVVYSETTVFTAAEKFAAEAPYQIAIIDTDAGRSTVRVVSETPGLRAGIGDTVEFLRFREGVAYYRPMERRI